jgi:glycosyltransferase involved in cell wall biosynthesis
LSKVILISQSELPSSKIGSWTTLYKNYLEGKHEIDYIVCPKPDSKFKNVNYQFVSKSFYLKLVSKIFKNPHLNVINALKKILNENKNENYIIQIVDNFKIVPDLVNFLKNNNLRNNCKIQFFYHGFPPFLDKSKGEFFYNNIDEMILLTIDSYKEHIKYYNSLPCKFNILPNAIDKNLFYKLDFVEKQKLKEHMNFKGKTLFIWCSQDRPKKGLHIILELWKKNPNPDRILIVIGTSNKEKIEGVIFLGKIPNSELPKYYQVSDFYLFPTLCQEGFGLSLIEALSCGCYCLASKIGGVPEVLQYGKYGKLIENPHIISQWEIAINELDKNSIDFIDLPKELYSFDNWREKMNQIINNAKLN